LDASWAICKDNSYAGQSYWQPPNYPATNDFEYNRHPTAHVNLFGACRDSNSCVAHVIWGVFDHANQGYQWLQCHGAEAAPYGVPTNKYGYGYGHPVILDCLSNGAGYCRNDGASYSYYRKRAWQWLSYAVNKRLVFDNGDARRTNATGDWMPNSYKAECGANDRATGLSVTPSSGWARSAFCRTDPSGRFPHNSCRTVSFRNGDSRGTTQTGDWDPYNFKGECSVGEYVAGVSQASSDHRVDGILCCQGSTLSHSSCSARIFNGGDARETYTSGDWDYGYWKGECGDNRYVAGVSASPSWATQPGRAHAILCCN
jgi:hypothetical protein